MDYEVAMREVPPEHLASVRGTYPISQLPAVMPKEFGRIMRALRAEGVQPAGGAVAIYHSWSEDTVDVEIAFAIKGVFFPQDVRRGAKHHPQGSVRPSMIPGGRVLYTRHVGPYDQIAAAYGAIQAYARTNDLKLADRMWEKYLTDPATEPDLGKHVAEVFWPLA